MKTISLFSDLLSRVTDIGKRLNLSVEDEERSLIEQCEGLLSREGEATSLAHASQILSQYSALDQERKKAFFEDLFSVFGVDFGAVETAIKICQEKKDEASIRQLHFISEPRSQNLLRRLNQAPNATLALVEMRKDLLGFARDNPALKELDKDLSHLFTSWFNRGFLQLERIDWSTSAEILEKIIAYEAVHQINGWDDLRQRVGADDRRLYAYFHPALLNEPLIFVEVALLQETPKAIAPILADKRDVLALHKATTAVFYSISNCQKGLQGISFGNFLIKQVVETLKQEFENLETFVTLSPIPGFRKWAMRQLDEQATILDHSELDLIEDLILAEEEGKLKDMLGGNHRLSNIISHYLYKGRSPGGGALNAVARFHLGNGAQLEDVHLLADLTDNGMKNSWGSMVNYQYHISDIETNHEAYFNKDQIAISTKVSRLLNKKS